MELKQVYLSAGIASLFLSYMVGLLTENWWLSIPSLVIGITNVSVGIFGSRLIKL